MINKILLRFFNIWRTPETTGQKVARGGAILFFERFLIRALQFVRTVIIARLLFPNDIGLFALASLALGTVSAFVQLGLNSAIIQEKKDVRKYLDNAWTANVLRGVFLAGVMFFGAPLFGDFFNDAAAIPLIQALALLALIEGFDNIGMVILQKELAMNKQFFYNIYANIAQIIIIISAALIFKNAWALVLGAIAGRLAYMVLSYVYHLYRPRFDFNFSGSWHLFKFGRWVALGGVVSFFAIRGDSLVIGKLLIPEDLAFYQMAFALGTLPAIEFVKALSTILFPLYSRLQGEKERIRHAFLRISRLILVLMIPASIGMFVLAPEIVTYVYGSRWLPMVPVLFVVIIFGFFKSFEYLVNPLFSGIGKPYISTVIMAIQSVVMFSVIFPLTANYGTVGTAWAALVGLVVAQAIYAVKLFREIRFNPLNIIRESFLPFFAGAIMWLLIILFKEFVYIGNHLLLLAAISVSILVYFLAISLLDRVFGGKLRESLLWIKRNI